ncbi:MAG: hypothetical protein COB29_16185 [Sulfitobacter sp.]|nr:MAG: hypothetical protein COB29_16185 [Sulfitobacter sp.]
MAKLESLNILADIENEKSKGDEKKAKPKRGARKAIAEEAGASKASPSEADLRVKLRDKVQCSLGSIPKFINHEFERLVAKSGMGKKEYFYHLLRGQGADIPPYDKLDGRRL